MIHYKIGVFGLQAVGKTVMTIQFIRGVFLSDHEVTWVETDYRRWFTVDKEDIQLDILDTLGQDGYSTSLTPFVREANGFIIIYAIDDRASFQEVEVFHRNLLTMKGVTNVPVVICGNKCDLEDKRVVSKTEGEELAERLHAKFFETSVLENLHIEDVFRTVVREIRKSESATQPSDKKESDKKGSKRGGNKGCIPL